MCLSSALTRRRKAACWAQNPRAGSAGKPAYVPGVPISLVMPDFEATVNTFTEADMISNTNLAADNTICLHPDTARDARLGQNDAIIANDHIMGDMNLIIDHHIRAKMRVIKNASVNGHACTNITALTRHHPAKMRNKTGFCPCPSKPNPRLPRTVF